MLMFSKLNENYFVSLVNEPLQAQLIFYLRLILLTEMQELIFKKDWYFSHLFLYG